MSLIFLRHSRPDLPEGICYGATDLPPGPTTEPDATRLAATLPDLARIVTSPLSRARTLAQAIAKHRNLPISIDPDLAEMNFGTWEMTPWDDIPRAQIDAWADDLLLARPPQGETVAELQTRVTRALTKPRPGPTLWVSHAGPYRAALATLDHPDPWTARLAFADWASLPVSSC